MATCIHIPGAQWPHSYTYLVPSGHIHTHTWCPVATFIHIPGAQWPHSYTYLVPSRLHSLRNYCIHCFRHNLLHCCSRAWAEVWYKQQKKIVYVFTYVLFHQARIKKSKVHSIQSTIMGRSQHVGRLQRSTQYSLQ